MSTSKSKSKSKSKSWDEGYVQVYTGDGKGKTSAALGLTVRAAGAGLRVLFAQFIKAGRTSEIAALERLGDQVTVRQFGLGHFIKGAPSDGDLAAARAGLAEVRTALTGAGYDVVILDEANDAVACGLFGVDELLDLIDAKRGGVELVITGRGADPALIDRADLVTEMMPVKHYYDRGVEARDGIEK
jgi:cob(I)alamin adenosyltransferase